MRRTKHPENCVVMVSGVHDIFYVNVHQYKRKPYTMTRVAAMCLKADLEREYHGKFLILKCEL